MTTVTTIRARLGELADRDDAVGLATIFGLLAAGAAVIIALVTGAAIAFDAATCAGRADDMGYDVHRWGPITGCIVQRDDGRFVSIDNVRDDQ